MKAPKLLIIVFLLSVFLSPQAHGKDIAAVEEIINKSNHVSMYQGNSSKGRLTLVITDKQGRKRKRQMNVLRKDETDDKDQKYFTYFVSPADVRKMVFMVHKHTQPGRDDDRWLYMPGLDLVKRIAASDKRTSFVGSDFLYEDISGRSPIEDKHELIKAIPEQYIVKNTPKNPETVEFEYYIAFIDRKNFIPMKIQYFKKQNRLYRELEVINIEQIEAKETSNQVKYPTVTESIARNFETGSQTQMLFTNIRYNCGLKDSIFSERYLRRPPRDAMR